MNNNKKNSFGLSRKPKLLIIYGIFMLIFSILAVIINHDFDGIVILLVLSIIFIIGGLQRLKYSK